MQYTVKSKRHHTHKLDHYGRRQPRPQVRRTGTRRAAVELAIREG